MGVAGTGAVLHELSTTNSTITSTAREQPRAAPSRQVVIGTSSHCVRDHRATHPFAHCSTQTRGLKASCAQPKQ